MARKIQPKSNFPRKGQSSEDYWRDRETRQRAQNIKEEAKTAEKINQIFKTVQDDLQSEIDAFYATYAKDKKISLTEARGRVTRADIEKYQRLAKKYVEAAKRGDTKTAFSKQANAQMKLYNLTMKVNRLEMLKARCGVRTMAGYTELEKLINDNLEARTYSEYERLASILGNSIQMNENLARSIVNASYQTATWSDRLWANQAELSNKIGSQLIAGIIAGRNSRELARQIQKSTGQSTFNCQRLMRTEMRRVQTAAAEQSMRDNGVRQYMYMVVNGLTGSRGACDNCLAHDGKVYDIDKMIVSENAPPLHPQCKCATAPYVDENKWQEWLDGPAQNGVPWKEFEAGQDRKSDTLTARREQRLAERRAKQAETLEKAKATQEAINRNPDDIKYDSRLTNRQTSLIKNLVDEYKTRLQEATVGAKKAAGDVQISGAIMRLNEKLDATTIHEFAHTIANSDADKYGLTHDGDFWKEIRKIRRAYHKDVDREGDSSRWISTYEHGSKSIDEFMADAFAHAKMRELGIPKPSKYGDDYTYSQQVLDVMNKYFKKKRK